MGYEHICYALYDDPGLVTEVCKISNEFFKEAARQSVEAGCVAIWVSEDLGSSSAGFFSLNHYQKVLLPPLHDGIPVENVVEMFRVGAEYGRAFARGMRVSPCALRQGISFPLHPRLRPTTNASHLSTGWP